jgi:hypothetical protein
MFIFVRVGQYFTSLLKLGALAYIYWTVYTSLVPSFFYYSVWQLGVAGQEITLLTTLSPILLSIPPIKNWAEARNGRMSLQIGGLVGIASYVIRFPSARMLCVGVSNACSSMVKASDWSKPDSAAYEGLREGFCNFIHVLDLTNISSSSGPGSSLVVLVQARQSFEQPR